VQDREVPAMASWATMVVRSAMVVGVILNGGLGLNRDEARQNEQGQENSKEFQALMPRGHGLTTGTHIPR
jgi:hypothetical protein